MTQVLSGPAAPTAAVRAPSPLDGVRRLLEGTPGQLRLAAVLGVLASLVFAGLGGLAFQSRANALSDASDHAAQLVRLQTIASDAVQADSQFTNGYLTYLNGGTESSAQLKDFTEQLTDATKRVTEAAQAAQNEPDDVEALASVNEALRRYSESVASARDNNRQGYQVATGYLRQAGWYLNGGNPIDPAAPSVLPGLSKLVTANDARVADAFAASQRATWLLVGAGVVGLGGLLAVQGWLARRTRRILNVPLAAGTAAVLVALVVGGLAMASAQSKAIDIRTNAYAATQSLATARNAAYAAKSAEGLELIYLGFGGDFGTAQKTFDSQSSAAAGALEAVLGRRITDVGQEQLKAWRAAHAALITTAQADWAASLTTATATGKGSLNATFDDFDAVLRPMLKTQADEVSAGLVSSRTLLLVLGWVSVVLGLLAAVAAWWGLSQRLEEYR